MWINPLGVHGVNDDENCITIEPLIICFIKVIDDKTVDYQMY